jgi:transcriptional regulator with XRE-family HTH domain
MARSRGPEYAALGRAVRVLRAELDLSQEAVGFNSGLHRNYVGAIERGEINPTYRVLCLLAAGLRVPLSEVFARAESLVPGDRSPSR